MLEGGEMMNISVKCLKCFSKFIFDEGEIEYKFRKTKQEWQYVNCPICKRINWLYKVVE